MNSEINYKNLSKRELKLLIKKNDDKALDEYTRRMDSGEIPTRSFTVEELETIYAERGYI